MKRAVIRFGIITLLGVIGFVFFANLDKEEKQSIVAENPEQFVDSSKKNKAIQTVGGNKKIEKGDEIVTGLETSLEKKKSGTTIQFSYEIRNSSDQKQVLQFTSSQRYEYEIYRGTELVERFSDGKSFLQALKDISLEPDETLSFDIEVSQLEKGEYSIEVWPVARGTSHLREKVDFTIN